MKGSDNLIPFNKRTVEEQRRIATQGGKASGVARAKKKAFKELLEIAFDKKVKVKGEEVTLKYKSALELVTKASKGDIKAITLAAELLGEKENKTELSINSNTSALGVDMTAIAKDILKKGGNDEDV